MRIGIIGFGTFGQFLSKIFVQRDHSVFAISRSDHTEDAKAIGATFITYSNMDKFLDCKLDCIVLSPSIISFEEVLTKLSCSLKKNMSNMLLVDVLSVKTHPKKILLKQIPNGNDILCTHPMFGPVSGQNGLNNLPFMYEKIRITNESKCTAFLDIFEREGCKLEEMTCELHDQLAAKSQFVTHTIARLIHKLNLQSTSINTLGFQNLLSFKQSTEKYSDNADLYYGLLNFNPFAQLEMQKMKEVMEELDRKV